MPELQMSETDEAVRTALDSLGKDDLDGSWSGRREREVVSLFAFGPLLDQVSREGFLQDSGQVGIEIAIPQVAVGDEDLHGKKSQVCKDLVIWPEPQMTCWNKNDDPEHAPAAVVEWKFGLNRVSQRDVNWLKGFTDEYPNCTGYAVTANQSGAEFTLSCTRVADGQEEPEWVYIS